jgi:PadR family transcriptional regulator PadR
MSNTRKPPDFLNGVPELLLLQLLAGRPMYGYELVQAIRAATDAVLEFGEGSIYPILHRLQAEGALSAGRQIVSGRSRVVYRLTASGHQRLAAAAANWQRIAQAVQTILQGGAHGQPALA